MKSPVRSAAVAIVAVLALLVSVAHADPTDQARQHFKRGRELYDAGDYRAAIAEFAAADQIAPSSLLEYNIALCHERLGEKSEAVRRYRAYLDRTPDAQNRAAVEEKIRKLDTAAGPPVTDLPPLPPDDGGPPTGPDPSDPSSGAPPTDGAGAAPAAPTGDPELDRVAGIDVGRVHAERRGGGQPPPPTAAAGMTAGASVSAGGPPPAAPPAERPEEKKSKPIYKQWWFWVVAGVSAIIIIDIATSDSDGGDSNLMFPAPGAGDRGAAPASGPVLLRF